MIQKVKEGYQVVSEKSGRNMGIYKTEKEAKKRLIQIDYFKHIKKNAEKQLFTNLKVKE
jgi:hypothetical protein